MLIRPAVTTDLAALLAVERSATTLYEEAGFPPSQAAPRTEEGLAGLLRSTRVLVAEDPAVVGYVSFYATGPYLHVEELSVARAAQRRGIGSRLLAAYLDHARQLPGCSHLSLVASRAADWAVRLYQRHGFREVEAGDWARLPAPERLEAILEAERAAGLDTSLRQVMVRAVA